MKRRILNAYNLHKRTILAKKYEKAVLISKYLLKSSQLPESNKLLTRLRVWGLKREYAASKQTAVCRRGGGFKRVINLTGFDRHCMRQELNIKRIPILKKMSW